MHYQKGFTIIELVLVIVIIGILAAAALPRFANLSSNAKLNTFQHTSAAFSTSMGLFHSGWLANGAKSFQMSVPWFGNGTLTSGPLGYPVGADANSYVGTAQDCIDIFNGLLDSSYTISAGPSGVTGSYSSLENLRTSGYTTDYVASVVVSASERSCRYACVACEYKSGSSTIIPILIYNSWTGGVTEVLHSY